MTPDQLRELADALSSGTHYVESPELHEAMMRAADLAAYGLSGHR